MVKINKHIEIVRSSSSWLSSMSQRSCDAVYEVLAKHYAVVGVTTVNNLSDLANLAAAQPDLVFMGMKFVPLNPGLRLQDPDKVWVSQYLDQHNIAYTGSRQKAHRLELNKHLAKQRVLDAGLQTSAFYVINQTSATTEGLLKFPVFIKPTSRGGGEGIDSNSVAYTADEQHSKVQSIAAELQSDSLIEEFLDGREFSVALLKQKNSSGCWVMPIEKVAPMDKRGQRILSRKIKSADSVRDLEVTDSVLKAKLTDHAMAVFEALGARDYGRIDIRLDASGTPQFLEANLLPSLIRGYGSFPKACALNIHMDYETMILHIAALGLDRTLHQVETIPEPLSVNYSALSSLKTTI